jgi:hypothetical protein
VDVLVPFLVTAVVVFLVNYGYWWGKGTKKRRRREDNNSDYGDDSTGTEG